MSRILVWDLPTRVLHWAFAGSLTAALTLGFGTDDEHPLFAYHMLFGLVAGAVLVMRIVLGLFGSRHARFNSWTWSPVALAAYARGVFTGTAPRYVAHNPANAWVSVTMFALVALLVATGIVAGELFEDTHEVLAAALIAAVALHLLGLIWHTARHRENIGRSMIDGRKKGPPEAALRSHRTWSGVFVAIGVLAFATALFRNYDSATARVRLPLLGSEVQLGESQPTDGQEHDGVRAHPHD